MEDLQQSGSVEATVENILDGNVQDLPAPPMFSSDELAAATAATSGGDPGNHSPPPQAPETEQRSVPAVAR